MRIVLLAILVALSKQDTFKPDCKPQTAIGSTKPSLIVFAFYSVIKADKKISRDYVVKTISCQVPIADNVRTYVLDYTKNAWDEPISEQSFVNSRELANQLNDEFKKPQPTTAPRRSKCECFKTAIAKFLAKDAVRSHENIWIIRPTEIDDDCDATVAGSVKIRSILITEATNGTAKFMSAVGSGRMDVSNDVASSELVEAADSLVKGITNVGSIDSSKTVKCSDGAFNWLLVATCAGALGIFICLIVIVGLSAVMCKNRKKRRVLEEMIRKEEEAEEKRQKEIDAKIARRRKTWPNIHKDQVDAKGQLIPTRKKFSTYSGYEDYCFNNDDALLSCGGMITKRTTMERLGMDWEKIAPIRRVSP